MSRTVVDFINGKNKSLFANIVIIGTGGTGGLLVQQLAQMLSIFTVRGRLLIADPDIVEEKNLKNQLFIRKDIGKKKADVLAARYRNAYQLDISSYSLNYVENLKTLDSLFNTDYLSAQSYSNSYLPILVSCVDNNFTRKLFHRYFHEKSGNLVYIDVGNEETFVPKGDRPKEQWTTDELDMHERSGYTGQLVAGIKLNGKIIADPVANIFPEILEDDDEIAPSELSCTNIIASNPQRLITNRYSAMMCATVMNEIFDTGTLSTHKIFFHSKKGYMRSEPITDKI